MDSDEVEGIEEVSSCRVSGMVAVCKFAVIDYDTCAAFTLDEVISPLDS